MTPDLTPSLLLRVAADADVDPRSVTKLLAGGNVRPRQRVRIVAALNKNGLGHLAGAAQSGLGPL
jgi:hypothetical protein